ncbi:MAG: extracellular solute-binding protein, partial [Sphaerospermopsis sp. SIO1G2]|nr:extracellular solute-binding protein [Sphaerospermopsis sp. SIO1G2]
FDFNAGFGCEVEVVEAKGGALLQRIQNEGEACPADVLITVDAGNLGLVDAAGLFQPVKSAAIEAAVPAQYRHANGNWVGYGIRSRVMVYNPKTVKVEDLPNSDIDLIDDKWRGRIAIRSSSNMYNQSLLASIIAAHGPEKARQWAAGMVQNFARQPQGNDRAQIKAVAAGEADIAVVNHYYVAKMIHSDDAEQTAAVAKVALHFPGQSDQSGAHANISGAGILKHAQETAEAQAFLEFLASPEGQQLFIQPSFEYPVVTGVTVDYPMFPADFIAAPVSAEKFAELNRDAVMIFDQVQWR